MKISWVTRAFADYRLPVFLELNKLSGGNLSLIYNKEIVKPHLANAIDSALGNRSVGLSGEKRIVGKNRENAAFANTGIRIPYQKKLIKSIKQTKPDVLISDGFFQWTYGPLLVNLTKGIPHIMCYERTAHTERNVQWYRVAYRKMAMKMINHIICSGSLCGDYVRSLGFPDSRISYGHMVADVNSLSVINAAITDDEIQELKQQFGAKYIFLYTGQIIKRKGIIELLTAWRGSQANNHKDIALVLIGSGDQTEEIQRLIYTFKIENVHLTGRVPYEQIATYYALADLFIIPTLEDNWSLVVPEAMATGLPIACSVYNGLWPELVTPENGWVFDPLNNTEFVRSLNDIFSQRDSFQKMGIKSKEIVQSHTPQKAAEVIWQACLNAIKDH